MNGFVDIQVNGILGVDFTGEGLALDDVRRATRELVKRGTIAYCPTVVEAPEETLRRNLSVLASTMDEPDLAGHILGVHLEGPFISPEDGARGAHQTQLLSQPSVDGFERLWEWAEGRFAILTLAPELPGAEELIRHAAKRGVIVSIGHTAADAGTIARAIEAGARCSTHLGNGIADMIHRHDNPIWPQLASDELFAGFVTDGHHVPPEFIKSAIRAKGVSRSIVVSDSVALAGMPPGDYDLRGKRLVLDTSGRLGLAGTPYLAGSAATMMQCMNHLASLGILTEDELWQVGRWNALKLLGIDAATVAALEGPEVEFNGNGFVLRGKAV